MGTVAVQSTLESCSELVMSYELVRQKEVDSKKEEIRNLSHGGKEVEFSSKDKKEEKLSHCGKEVEFSSKDKKEEKLNHCGIKETSKIEEEKLSHCGKKDSIKVEEKMKVNNCRKVNRRIEEDRKLNHCEERIYEGIQNEKFRNMSNQDSTEVLVGLFEKIHKSGLPNYKGCRIPLPFVGFNIPLWRELLADYHDKTVCDFLEFGFPLDFDRSVKLCTNERRNHKGARDHPEFVRKYLIKETQKRRIAGPFKSNPLSIPIMVSPLNTVPKDSGDERRVIVDLSWPLGRGSVNSGISKESYLEERIEANYGSVEEVCQMVLEAGPGALIYKRDLRQAYRQFPIDPFDYYLLGYFWEDHYYIDTVLAMGQRNAGFGCSRVSNAVMHIHSKSGHHGLSYLDDLIGVNHPSVGSNAYDHLGSILRDLGLEENIPKACPPSTIQTVLGVLINTEQMTISVTDKRMKEISVLLAKWKKKKVCRKKELQSLIGKLCFVCKCVRQSRVFLNRLLAVLRSVNWDVISRVSLSEDFHKELRWWSTFMISFNGVALIPSPIWSEPDVSMATDSCLDGCGGICSGQYFHTKFSKTILDQSLPIHQLEFLAVLVGARIWGHLFKGQKIRIFCDNMSVVEVINSSKTKDVFMATCLRELWLVVAQNEFEHNSDVT